MKLIRGLHNIESRRRRNPGQRCVLTIGNFDGVHRGHQMVIRQLRRKADELGLPAYLMIFEPQPLEFFDNAGAPPRLTGFREKLRLLSLEPIDSVVSLQFDAALSNMQPAQFVERILVDGLGVDHLIIGDDFRFGARQQGDFEFLKHVGKAHGFGVDRTETVLCKNQRASSTLVREALAESDFSLAEDILRRPYSIAGRVMHGQELGRQLGSPTANLSMKGLKPPLSGVYAVEAELTGRNTDDRVKGVANIGVRPTVEGETPVLEVHLFDFDEAIYGERLRVIFRHKIRDEQRFDGLDALKEQIQRDIAVARDYFGLSRSADVT